ncbi:MAG: DnaJ domain-containing protein [Gammaproteobacteria bacterium]
MLRWFQKTSPDQIRSRLKKTGWNLAIIALLLLTVSGKLNVLFGMLGVAIAFLARALPSLLHYAPRLHHLWMLYFHGKQQQQGYRHDNRESGRPRGDPMTKTEALAVLGLRPGASDEEIIQAHRKLILKLHPDRGGSDYLAAQINLAKKTLLGR